MYRLVIVSITAFSIAFNPYLHDIPALCVCVCVIPSVVHYLFTAAKGRTNLELRSEQLLLHAPGVVNGTGMTELMTGFSARRKTPAPTLTADQPLTLDLLAAGTQGQDACSHCPISPGANPHTHVAVIDHLDEMPHSAQLQAAAEQLGLPLNPVVKVRVVRCSHALPHCAKSVLCFVLCSGAGRALCSCVTYLDF